MPENAPEISEMTIADAYQAYLLPHLLSASRHTQRGYVAAIRLWQRMQVECRVCYIADSHFAEFRARVLADGLSPFTAEHSVGKIVSLLRHLGPRSASVPHGRGLLAEVPYPGRRLSMTPRPKSAVTIDQLSSVYSAAKHATYPLRLPMSPPIFWRVLLAVAYHTGLRCGDLWHSLAWDHVDFKENMIIIPAGKTGKMQGFWINDVLRAHLDMLPHREGRLFPVHKVDGELRNEMARLSAMVGVPRFGMHSIRRRAAIEFERAHYGAGSLLLGHALSGSSGMTFGHYIPSMEVLIPAAEKLREPRAMAKAVPFFRTRRLSRRIRRLLRLC